MMGPVLEFEWTFSLFHCLFCCLHFFKDGKLSSQKTRLRGGFEEILSCRVRLGPSPFVQRCKLG